MASTSYLLEWDYDRNHRPKKLGAFTTMDKAIAAAKSHMHWEYNRVGKEVPPIHTSPGSVTFLYTNKPDSTNVGDLYQITKLRTR